MALNFNTSPYHDDYDETKRFYRVLFRPGRAVQARELTQLQTSLQNQIARFGQNIFKEGSIVIPGHSVIDTYLNYVKLTTSYNSVNSDDVIDNLVGLEITGQTTGVRARVIDYSISEGSDPSTIYVTYLDSGTNKTTRTFAADEILVSADQSISVRVAASAATGQGVRFSIQAGVVFVKGVFAYFDDLNYIVSKYDRIISKSIGFNVTESIVTSDDDEDLLDPASGSFNYFAPGADRYKISLDLSSRNLQQSDLNTDFVELARIENGIVISIKKDSDYNILGDVLAKRTFEESGNYTVRPYSLELINHLRTSNADLRDGLLTSADGGNADVYVGIIQPGKAYVMGYEIENLKSQYVPILKARDFVSVNQGTIPTEIGNYVLITGLYSAPDIASHTTLKLYNRYTSSNGSSNGTQVGTARPRALEYYSGSGASTVYKLYLFDIQMNTPYKFERDVKQVYYDNTGFADFTANTVSKLVTLTGTVSTTNGSATVNGSGTRFSTELSTNNFISINGNVSEVINIVSDYQLTLLNSVVGNISGFTGYRLDSNVALANKNAYVFELPYNTIKTVDPTNVETTYYTRRVYDRTLSGGNVTITAGTNEVFTTYSADDYIGINKTSGAILPLTGNVTLGGSPTGKTVTITLGYSGASFLTDDVRIITTVAKSNNAADKKIKTLVSTYIDYSANINATSTLNLAQADIYKISNVLMSSNTFGNSFLITEATDITSRYIIDNGQRRTHYDTGRLTLRPGAPKPTGPVRVYYDYFTHSAGDYCTVDSYPDISYEKIPVFVDGSKVYQLRDCIDFRPVIDSNGTTFTSPTEFLNQSVYFTTDYQYYLAKIDKIVIDSSGIIKAISGPSSLTPVEPATPENTMAMYVLKQKPYVFDVKKDIEVSVIDNRRFTMRDIGRIENRVKNLEYYTELSLLELQAKSFTIKDGQGLDRFKNGFIVDNFTGHNVGDPKNPDYSVSMDFTKGEIRPLFAQINLPLSELSGTNSARDTKNYTITGNIASLPYTVETYISSNVASRVINVNPFTVVGTIGVMELDPPADVWFETEKLPDLFKDAEDTLSTLQYDSAAKGTYNTIWGGWEIAWVGGRRVEQRSGIEYSTYEKTGTTTSSDVVVSSVIIPKMRSKQIKFAATGLKANTRVHAFFDGYKVTNFCSGDYTSTGTLLSDASVSDRANDILSAYATNFGNLFTDANGTVTGTFNYDANFLNLPSGSKTFRLTDSPNNGGDFETAASAIFNSSGEKRQVRNEIVSTRYSYNTQKTVYDTRDITSNTFPQSITVTPPTTPPTAETTTPTTYEYPDTITPSIYPVAGTDLGIYCDGYTLKRNLADGSGGYTTEVLAYNHPDCGYPVQTDPVPVVVQAYYPSSDAVDDVLLTGGYTTGKYDVVANAVQTIGGLPETSTVIRQMEQRDIEIQQNLQNATTDSTDGAFIRNKAATEFFDSNSGKVKVDFFNALADGSWASGLTQSTIDEIAAAKQGIEATMMDSLKQSDGTIQTPNTFKLSMAGQMLEAINAGYAPVTQFLGPNADDQEKLRVAVALTASLVTAGAIASQSLLLGTDVPWDNMCDKLVTGTNLTLKPPKG